MKRGGGRRYYRPDDLDLLRGIRHLLYGEGYTIRGVQRLLREQGVRFVQNVWQPGAPQRRRRHCARPLTGRARTGPNPPRRLRRRRWPALPGPTRRNCRLRSTIWRSAAGSLMRRWRSRPDACKLGWRPPARIEIRAGVTLPP